jgi:hypothetical protein
MYRNLSTKAGSSRQRRSNGTHDNKNRRTPMMTKPLDADTQRGVRYHAEAAGCRVVTRARAGESDNRTSRVMAERGRLEMARLATKGTPVATRAVERQIVDLEFRARDLAKRQVGRVTGRGSNRRRRPAACPSTICVPWKHYTNSAKC